MFIAYQVAVELLTDLRPIVVEIQKHDSNLADQLKRAATSVVANLAEGQRRIRGNQRRAFEIAHVRRARCSAASTVPEDGATCSTIAPRAASSIACSPCAGASRTRA